MNGTAQFGVCIESSQHDGGRTMTGWSTWILWQRWRLLAVGLALGALMAPDALADFIRREVSPGVYATVKAGRRLSLECDPPPGKPGEALLRTVLADANAWSRYKGKGTVAIDFKKLRPAVQRRALLSVYTDDVVNEHGWTHFVADSRETLWTLSEWLTGRGDRYKQIMSHNDLSSSGLRPGQRIEIPRKLLSDVMRIPTPDRRLPVEAEFIEPDPAEASEGNEKPPSAASAKEVYAPKGPLHYRKDGNGAFAVYEFARGDTLYSAVGKRFTTATKHADVMTALEAIVARSGINDVRDIDAGTEVRIPIELLAKEFQPGTPAKIAAAPGDERVLQASQPKPAAKRSPRKPLSGVVIVLDPGHGGVATGAEHAPSGLYEDEIVYDICVRVYQILTAETDARVYLTMLDRSQGLKPTNQTRFQRDEDEEILTTPKPYANTHVKTSLYLRSYLANAIYRREVNRGVHPENIVFTSMHADSLGNTKARGTMVYVPSALLRGLTPAVHKSGSTYDQYNEVRQSPHIRSTRASRERDEMLSRQFAETLLDALGRHNPPIRRHLESEPIRDRVIRRGNVQYVPSIIKHNDIPTKVLVEVANVTNSTDRQRMADPEWRQWFAEAYVDALIAHFEPPARIARAGG